MTTEAKMKTNAAEALKSAATPLEKLRNHLLTKGYSGIMSFGRLFRRADDDGTWTLSEEELTEAVGESGLDLSETELSELYKQFQKDGQEGVTFDEFLEALRPEMTPGRVAAVEAAYKKLDATGDGVVSLEDLKGVYTAKDHPKVVKGEMTEEEVLLKFLAGFEGTTTTDGKLTRQEFLNYYASLSTAIDEDEYFIEVVKMMWGLE